MKKVFITLLILSVLFTNSSAFAADVYDSISEMIDCYKNYQASRYDTIMTYLDEIKTEDEALGRVWENIMNYWAYVNTDITVNFDNLPSGLPEDDSLCIIVLGYRLHPNGTMTDELIGRCSTALECAQQYPNAFIAVTGGGTSTYDKEATEAGRMADWLIEKGIDPARIITEDQSLTTVENARFTCEILKNKYPQVKELAIVTSEYHVPLGCLLFRAQLAINAYTNNTPEEVHVLSNAAYNSGPSDHITLVWQAADLRNMAFHMR